MPKNKEVAKKQDPVKQTDIHSQGEQEVQREQRKPDQNTVEEVGGPSGPEPTRYGDWEVGGRCSDF
ncbi:MAG: DUF1674 domain-containing protein [Gammaproteobacteria bacterium]|nr:DUF1674 domain-containing protein [Gammaproteobacteria bacterium]